MTNLVDQITEVLTPMVRSDMRWPDTVQAERRARSMAHEVRELLIDLAGTGKLLASLHGDDNSVSMQRCPDCPHLIAEHAWLQTPSTCNHRGCRCQGQHVDMEGELWPVVKEES